MAVGYQILYKGRNIPVKHQHIFNVVIRLLAEADYTSMTIEKVEAEKCS